jgi:phosphomevalonate kinase
MIRVHAPGKLVLVGEYAVLEGGAAAVLAVQQGVTGRYWPGPALRWEVPSDDRFVRPVLEAEAAPAGTYAFSDWNPIPLPGKPGLGGSAAAVVAATALAHAARGAPLTPAALAARAQAAHPRIQGSGSGIDVAAAALGGLLHFCQGQASPRSLAQFPTAPVVVYSGSSSSTGPRVAHYLASPDRGGFPREMADAVARFWEDPIGGLRDALSALDRLQEQIGLPYWTPGLRRLVALAAQQGGAAKPSGAGGGDVAVALFPTDDQREAYRRAVAREGFVVLETPIAGPALAEQEQTDA